MKQVDIYTSPEWANFNDNDMVVIDDVKKLPLMEINGVFKTKMILVVICTGGKIEVKIENTPYTIHKNEVMICAYNTMISDCMLSTDLEMFAIGVNPGYLDKNIFIDKKFWEYAEFVESKHVMALSDEEILLLMHYYDIGKAALEKEDGKVKDLLIKNLKQCFIYEFYDIIKKKTPGDYSIAATSDIRQEDLIFRKFIGLLNESDGKKTKVSDFAYELNITPKYLSMLVKKVSRKSCLTWIHEFIVKEIRRELAYPEKTISQISMDLGFPNVSFFSKFVKNHLGSSPTNIRKGFSMQEKSIQPLADVWKAPSSSVQDNS